MENLAMKQMLANGDCINVRAIGKEIFPGLYELNSFTDNIDYCDAERELWIWSIGKDKTSGRIVASTDGRFFQNPEFECLWLR
jgi:hypothetical protein